jgi:hypothetical protein
MVAHAYYPSYLEGGTWKEIGSKSVLETKSTRPHLNQPWYGGVLL